VAEDGDGGPGLGGRNGVVHPLAKDGDRRELGFLELVALGFPEGVRPRRRVRRPPPAEPGDLAGRERRCGRNGGHGRTGD
jgi:hypothetical protein